MVAQEQVGTTSHYSSLTGAGRHHVSLLVADPVERYTVPDATSETPFLGVSGEVLDCLKYERL